MPKKTGAKKCGWQYGQVWLNAIQLTRHSFGDLDATHPSPFLSVAQFEVLRSGTDSRVPGSYRSFAEATWEKNKDVNDLYCQLVPRFVFLTITGLDWWCVHTAFSENMRPPDWATQQCKTSIQTCEYLSGTTLVGASGSMRASRTDSCHFHWSFQLDGMIKREGWNKQLMFSVCLLFQEMFVLHLFAVHPMQPDSLGDKTEENCPVPEFEDRLWACILGCRRHIMTRMIFSTLFCAHVGPPWALFFLPCFNNE